MIGIPVASENDDQLDPAEVEALLKSAGGGPVADPAAAGASGNAAAGRRGAGTGTDALLRERSRAGTPTGNPDALLERAAADLAAAVAPDTGASGHGADPAVGASPFQFQPFDDNTDAGTAGGLSNLNGGEFDLRIELGRTELPTDEVLKLREGSVVALDKLAGDPVDILVNGRLIARGEVLVLNDNFCVRIAEILAPALE
jgi:flagellar motor switch protein FliN/FliY